jgi:uncharacterized LabA/DUF88 family protein
LRVSVYIDGFNLYHAVVDLDQPYLKWLNLWKLSERLASGHGKLDRVIYCTAWRDRDTGKKARHRFYVDALELVGVTPVFGHEADETLDCRACGSKWTVKREKATDLNLGLGLYQDALDDLYDVAFVLSADSDQAAAFAFVKKRFPQKKLFTVAPPGRPLSKHLYNLADGKKALIEKDLHAAIFGKEVTDGKRIVTRPREYDPVWEQTSTA